MVTHVSIKACEVKNSALDMPIQRNFFDIYEGKLKYLVEMTTSQIQSLNKCYRETDRPLED